jgi:AcrR family transcriptional regulator
MALQNRTRAAILQGAKLEIADVGSYESNMIDISTKAQVSRATVYNHFSDKEEMILALIESEINRLSELAASATTPRDALFALSRDISKDLALAKMRVTDPTDIAKFVTISDHPLWKLALESAMKIFGPTNGNLVLHWLISQIGSPLSEGESSLQSEKLARSFI